MENNHKSSFLEKIKNLNVYVKVTLLVVTSAVLMLVAHQATCFYKSKLAQNRMDVEQDSYESDVVETEENNNLPDQVNE